MAKANADQSTIRANLNYFDRTLARGRFDLVEPERNLMAFEAHEVALTDMRAVQDRLSIEQQGFMLAAHDSQFARHPDMLETNLVAQNGLPPINRAYYDELLPLVQEISGARDVIPQATGLTVRFSMRAQRQSWAAAAGFIHLDVSARSVGRFLDFSLAAATAEGRLIKPWRRVVLFQTWRVISDPPQDNLLALCDRQSVTSDDVAYYDAALGEKGSTLDCVEASSCRHNPAHRWYYTSNMGERDVLLFIGHDSDQPDAPQPYHSGFDVPGCVDAQPRASLEARFFAFYD